MQCAEFSKLRIFLQNNPAEICRDLGRGVNLRWEGFLDVCHMSITKHIVAQSFFLALQTFLVVEYTGGVAWVSFLLFIYTTTHLSSLSLHYLFSSFFTLLACLFDLALLHHSSIDSRRSVVTGPSLSVLVVDPLFSSFVLVVDPPFSIVSFASLVLF